MKTTNTAEQEPLEPRPPSAMSRCLDRIEQVVDDVLRAGRDDAPAELVADRVRTRLARVMPFLRNARLEGAIDALVHLQRERHGLEGGKQQT